MMSNNVITSRNKAYTGLLDVGDRCVDLEGLADRLAALRAQFVVPESAEGPPQ